MAEPPTRRPGPECAQPESITSTSLLERAKVGESSAWERMVRLYFPLVYSWCASKGLKPEDCLDISQEVFVSVSRNLQSFEKAYAWGSFRGWLRKITEGKMVDHWRKQKGHSQPVGGSQAHEVLMGLEDPVDEVELPVVDESEKVTIFRAAVELIRNEFEPRTWNAFWRVTADSQPVDVVAEQLGMSKNAVYLAKSRVLRRLREMVRDLFDDI